MNAPYEQINAMAARICGIKPKLGIPQTVNTYQLTTTTGEGRAVVKVICRCIDTDRMEVDKVLLDGVDIYMALTEDTINALEMECLAAQAKDRAEEFALYQQDLGESQALAQMEQRMECEA